MVDNTQCASAHRPRQWPKGWRASAGRPAACQSVSQISLRPCIAYLRGSHARCNGAANTRQFVPRWQQCHLAAALWRCRQRRWQQLALTRRGHSASARDVEAAAAGAPSSGPGRRAALGRGGRLPARVGSPDRGAVEVAKQPGGASGERRGPCVAALRLSASCLDGAQQGGGAAPQEGAPEPWCAGSGRSALAGLGLAAAAAAAGGCSAPPAAALCPPLLQPFSTTSRSQVRKT